MSHFSLPKELNQLIVNGILDGYKKYLDVRRDAQKKYLVSRGFTWTKANIIDTFVAKACSKYEGIDFTIDKAGYTWEYLQFTLKDTQEKVLFIVKNSWGVERTFNGKKDKSKKENYLYDYAGINNPIVDKKMLKFSPSQKSVQLEFDLTEKEEIGKSIAENRLKDYNRFYVVVYEFDAQSKMISKIALTLPNQYEMRLIEVDDLTSLIKNSHSVISSYDLKVVQNDRLPQGTHADDNQSFGYGIAVDNQEGSQ
ncbi:spr1630 family ClpXP-sensitive toxin [Staphylococcus americanisciuri]|uniref:Uncharacterized protein n=1 Tax=Staphylococcus americanisciuri TaxID=2973940 RepID=A0ABT2F1B5_9STAP|nr:hypothetical protein [Staphylococcus americanisciuri]MCS4486250.1 hypothetical protein [Staphylococcus americanisciuri]